MATHHPLQTSATATGPSAIRPTILIVPGLNNSGPGHWQTLWEQQRDDCRRVDLGMWDRPHRNTWVNKLNHAIRAVEGPIILAAHSLGCLAVAWWAQLEYARRDAEEARPDLRGALLVAPPEVDHAPLDPRIAGFAPTPAALLPFPAILVGSRNDPYMPYRTALALARTWGCNFADAGHAGHINAQSDLGEWRFGQFLLGQLAQRGEPGQAKPLPAQDQVPGRGPAHASKWELHP